MKSNIDQYERLIGKGKGMDRTSVHMNLYEISKSKLSINLVWYITFLGENQMCNHLDSANSVNNFLDISCGRRLQRHFKFLFEWYRVNCFRDNTSQTLTAYKLLHYY